MSTMTNEELRNLCGEYLKATDAFKALAAVNLNTVRTLDERIDFDLRYQAALNKAAKAKSAYEKALADFQPREPEAVAAE